MKANVCVIEVHIVCVIFGVAPLLRFYHWFFQTFSTAHCEHSNLKWLRNIPRMKPYETFFICANNSFVKWIILLVSYKLEEHMHKFKKPGAPSYKGIACAWSVRLPPVIFWNIFTQDFAIIGFIKHDEPVVFFILYERSEVLVGITFLSNTSLFKQ